jgi:hypothetical protein
LTACMLIADHLRTNPNWMQNGGRDHLNLQKIKYSKDQPAWIDYIIDCHLGWLSSIRHHLRTTYIAYHDGCLPLGLTNQPTKFKNKGYGSRKKTHALIILAQIPIVPALGFVQVLVRLITRSYFFWWKKIIIHYLTNRGL